jgi:hypothetical protein
VAWQRQSIQRPAATDFTTSKVGEKVIWKVSEIVLCPHCGEPGARFDESTVIHRLDADMDGVDVCKDDPEVTDDDPAVLVYDEEGEEIYRAPRGRGGN